ncbi:MAG TPA: nodulation protein NfeD [Rhodanobacteraceae bacterium]|nr:nodulation protein NfeD [Rhodanobacteraceae bacterium]
MGRSLLILLLGLLPPAAACASAQPAGPADRGAWLMHLDDAVGPASADYVERGIARANAASAAVIVLEIDTPGGLDGAMRGIVKAILASPVPVVGFVAPGGSRAASAGTYILYACHIAAMAPATNLGAATPVQLIGGGKPDAGDAAERQRADDQAPAEPAAKTPARKPKDAESRKVENDAVAYIRALAERRGRNADWAEKAVREAASLPARAALEAHVIDLMADDVPDLLAKIDGRSVVTAAGTRVLNTRGVGVREWTPDWRSRFLSVIANPSIAYILLLLGIYGLLFEGYSPGAVLPGVVGAICLLLALYAFQLLPVNFAGLALIALGVVLIVAETFVPAYGSLGIGGVVAFVIGSVVLMDTDLPGYGVSLPLLIGVSLVAALLVVAIIWLALRARRRPVVTGREQMIGSLAVALADFRGRGAVQAHGERWQAQSDLPVRAGESVRISAIDGLTLIVTPVDAGAVRPVGK